MAAANVEGKTLWFLTFCVISCVALKANLQGGLIFLQNLDRPIYINRDKMLFSKKANTSPLIQAGTTAQEITVAYSVFCNKLTQSVKYHKMDRPLDEGSKTLYYVAQTYRRVRDASVTCKQDNAVLPEIRSQDIADEIRSLALKHNITYVRAGIYWDHTSQTLRFYSDDQDATDESKNYFPQMEYVSSSTLYLENYQHGSNLLPIIKRGPIAYVVYNQKFSIRALGAEGGNLMSKAICMKMVPNDNRTQLSYYIQATAHNCNRDVNKLKAATGYVLKEINAVTSLNVTESTLSEDSFDLPINTDENYMTCNYTRCRTYNDALEIIKDTAQITAAGSSIPASVVMLDIIYRIHRKYSFVPNISFDKWLDSLTDQTWNRQAIETDPSIFLQSLAQEIKGSIKRFPRKAIKYHIDIKPLINKLYLKLNTISRKKRVAPALLAVGGAALMNSVTSGFTGSAPLSWFGDPIASLLGLQTTKQTRLQAQAILQNTEAIQDLSINQQELQNGITLLKATIVSITSWIMNEREAMATFQMEQDIKASIRQFHMLIQISLTKFANILAFAAMGKPSPYALSQKELDTEVTNFLKKGIILSADLSEVQAELVATEDEIYFIFSVPTKKESHLFTLYSVEPLPLFIGNATYQQELDAKYVAISASNSDYTILTDNEFSTCITNPSMCSISAFISPVTDQAHCVVRSLMRRTQYCPVKQVSYRNPYFAFYKNKTIFSVPEPMVLSISCQIRAQTAETYATIEINGTGEASFKPSCTIRLPDGRKYHSAPDPVVNTIEQSDLFTILNYIPTFTNYTAIENEAEHPKLSFPEVNLIEVRIPDTKEMLKNILNPTNSIPFIVRFGAILGLILSLLLLACICFPKFRRWILSCCLLKDPTRWLRRFKTFQTVLPEKEKPKGIIKKIRVRFSRKRKYPYSCDSAPRAPPRPYPESSHSYLPMALLEPQIMQRSPGTQLAANEFIYQHYGSNDQEGTMKRRKMHVYEDVNEVEPRPLITNRPLPNPHLTTFPASCHQATLPRNFNSKRYVDTNTATIARLNRSATLQRPPARLSTAAPAASQGFTSPIFSICDSDCTFNTTTTETANKLYPELPQAPIYENPREIQFRRIPSTLYLNQ